MVDDESSATNEIQGANRGPTLINALERARISIETVSFVPVVDGPVVDVVSVDETHAFAAIEMPSGFIAKQRVETTLVSLA